MKTFIRKNNVLLAVLGVLLIGAAVLAVSLITAAKAEASKQEVLARTEETAGAPTPSPLPEMESSIFASMLEHRRKTSIPVVDNVAKMVRGEWSQVADYSQADGEKAKAELIRIVEGLFLYRLDAQALMLEYWKDETGHRDDYWRITDADALVVGCLKVADLSLLAVDFDVIKVFGPSTPAPDSVALVMRLTDTLGGRAISSEGFVTMSASDNAYGMENLQVVMEDGSCFLMGRYLNTGYDLYAVSAHPNEDCMAEHVHWTADSQFSEAYIQLKAPINFVEGVPEKADMSREQAIAFYQRFITALKGSPDGKEPSAQFWLDQSGARENCWELSGTTASMTLSAKTKRLLYTTINELDVSEGTPGHAVSKILYDEIDQKLEQFYAYIRHVVEYTFGEGSVRDISVNAIADGVMCTIDAYFENESTVYEFCFNNSVLERIDYYESEELFWYGYPGWPANFLQENLETGETFYPY